MILSARLSKMRRRGILLIVTLIFASTVLSLECYNCNSNDLTECAQTPDNITTKSNCPNDECVTTIMNGVTHRGCLSKVITDGNCQPENLCQSCKSPLCNNEIYPKDRHFCFQCSGTACNNVTKSNIQSMPCRQYVKQDKCYTNVINLHSYDTRRGCMSDTSKTCSASLCKMCSSSNCNDVVGVFVHKCYSCQFIERVPSFSDPSCKRPQYETDQCSVSNLKTCPNRVVLGEKGTCFTMYNEQLDVYTRGCSTTMGPTTNSKVTECYGELCNNECLDIKCIICDSIKDPKCRNQTNFLRPQKCPQGTFRCFGCENRDGHVVRGCGGEEPEGYHCSHFYGVDGSNKASVRTCYKCSSPENLDCVLWKDTSEIERELCATAQDKCVIKVLPSASTIRGCESTIKECTEMDPICQRCDGSLCNEDIFPKDRVRCHRCTGTRDCNITKLPSEAVPCINYTPQDHCFAFAIDNQTMVRGCSSDVTFRQCQKLGPGKCRKCFEDGCNDWPLLKQPSMLCIKCTEGDEACGWAYDKSQAQPCRALVPVHLKESCYTYEKWNGTFTRGCTVDDYPDLKADNKMVVCDSSECNTQGMVFQECIQCSSRNGLKQCKNSPSEIKSTICSKSIVQPFETRGCYTKMISDGEIIRGCAVELDDEDKIKCKKNPNYCSICKKQGCNNKKFPSGCERIKPSLPLFFVLFTYFNKRYQN